MRFIVGAQLSESVITRSSTAVARVFNTLFRRAGTATGGVFVKPKRGKVESNPDALKSKKFTEYIQKYKSDFKDDLNENA